MKKGTYDIYAYGKDYHEWEQIIDRWVFDEKHRKMLKRHLLDGITYENMESEFQLSSRQIARVMERLMDYLFSKVKMS